MAAGITIAERDDAPQVVPTLKDIRDLLKSIGSGGGGSRPTFASQVPKILGPEQYQAASEAANLKDIRSQRINADAAGRAIPQLLKGDFMGAFNTRANAGAAQASLAGNAGAAEGILAGASKLNAAFAIASAAVEVGTAGLKAFREGTQYAGEQARRLASNDHLGMLVGATEHAAQTMEKIPVVGKLYGEAIRAATAPVVEFAKTMEAFVQRGKELSRYDAGLAAANAKADTARILADVDEAKALGESLGRLTEAQSSIEITLRELLLPVKQLLAELLTDVAEPVADLVQLLKPFVAFVIELLRELVAIARKLNPLGAVSDVLKALRGNEGEADRGELNSLMRRVLGADGALGSLDNGPAANQAAVSGDAFQQATGKPLFAQ